MNSIKIKLIRNFLKKYDGAEDFINDRIEEIYFHGKLFAEEGIHFLVSFFRVYVFLLALFLPLK